MQYLGVEHHICAAASPAKKTHDTVDTRKKMKPARVFLTTASGFTDFN